MKKNDTIKWLLEGDVSIQYQTWRDLLDVEKPKLQRRIAKEGWGAQFISKRNNDGHWGQRYYQPKWTSSHYTILDLRYLNIHPDDIDISGIINELIEGIGEDGGIYPIGFGKAADVCLNGMFLYYACYFGVKLKDIKSVVDFLLREQMDDGGFNCMSNRKGARHSSLHTTLSVLEGILEYRKNGFSYRVNELKKAEEESREFILEHRLYKSSSTGETINQSMITLHYPPRWYSDILRSLDYFRSAGCSFDERMQDAVYVIMKKRKKDGKWPLQAHHPGKRHFEMETVGQPSRWNTLRALRVLKHFGLDL